MNYEGRPREAIADRPMPGGRVEVPDPVTERVRFRNDLYAVIIVDQEWSWLHPRYRWLVEYNI